MQPCQIRGMLRAVARVGFVCWNARMPTHRQRLREQQIAVLRWIADGCPPRVMVGFTYKTTGYALRDRGLVYISKRGGRWSATITEAGTYYLEHGDYPAPKEAPAPTTAKVTLPTHAVRDPEPTTGPEPDQVPEQVGDDATLVSATANSQSVSEAQGVPAGEHWAYRLRDSAPSEHVLVINTVRVKNAVRIVIEFVDGHKAGTREHVPKNRLRVPWSEVAGFDERMANWERIAEDRLDDVERDAVGRIFGVLIPEGVAEPDWTSIDYATTVHDRVALAQITKLSMDELAQSVASFELDGDLVLSPKGTVLIAQAACSHNPIPVLAMVDEWEQEVRDKVKRGSEHTNYMDNTKYQSTPEWEYRWYRMYDRPRIELVRQWCGHRAISFHERLVAAEAENNRLDALVARLIDALKKKGDNMSADSFETEHEKYRITPEQARTIIDRPLEPWEMLVQYMPAKRRWPKY